MLRTCAVRLPAIEFTESVRSFHVPPTPGTSAWPPSLPSVPTSRATRVTSAANELSWSTIVLMVFFSSRISPRTSTVICVERSPFATAVVTSAMLRTWVVRLPAMELTESVRSFQTPATPFTSAWPPSLPSVPTSRATRVTSEANELSWSTIVLMVFFSSRISPRASTVILVVKSPRATAVVTPAMLRTWLVRLLAMELTESVRSFHVPADAPHYRLAAQLAFGSHFARHARHFAGERVQLLHHGVHHARGVQELALQRTPVHFERHGLRQVALGHRADHARHFGRRLHQVADQAVDRLEHSAHAPVTDPIDARWVILPSLPTARLMRANSLTIFWLSSRMSFKSVGNLALDAGLIHRHANGKVPSFEGDQGL